MVKRVLVQKKDKVMNLVKKSYMTVSKRHLEVSDIEVNTPQQLQPLVSSIQSLINEVSLKIDREQDVLKPFLQSLPEEKLQELLELHKEKSSIYTEDKLVAMATIFLKELQHLDDIIGKSHHMKNQLIHCFIKAYASEYSNTSRSDACYDNEKFRADVKTAIGFRQGFRRSVEVASMQESETELQDEARCILM